MQLSSDDLPGAKFMILRGFGCCCNIITNFFYIKQRKNIGLKSILLLDSSILFGRGSLWAGFIMM